jgi:hypothetical protein
VVSKFQIFLARFSVEASRIVQHIPTLLSFVGTVKRNFGEFKAISQLSAE